MTVVKISHLPSASLKLPQEPGRTDYYNQLFCLCGHHGGVSEIQTLLDVSDLKIGQKRSRRIHLLFISHAQLPVTVARFIIQTSWESLILDCEVYRILATSYHIVTALPGAGNTMTSA